MSMITGFLIHLLGKELSTLDFSRPVAYSLSVRHTRKPSLNHP
jgi:hypothetical protein